VFQFEMQIKKIRGDGKWLEETTKFTIHQTQFTRSFLEKKGSGCSVPRTEVLPVKMTLGGPRVGVDSDATRDFLFSGIKEKKPVEKAGHVLFPIHFNRENLRPRQHCAQ
jgi:hypothetical protein